VLPLIGGPVVVTLLYMTSRDDVQHWNSRRMSVVNSLFILLNYFQQVGMLRSFSISWPGTLETSWGAFEVVLKFQDVLKPQCAGVSSFQARFVTQMLLPITIAIIFLFTFAVSRLVRIAKPEFGMNMLKLFNCYGSVMYTFSVAVAALAFELFRCYRHPNGERSMQTASEVLCGSDTWNSMLAIGVLGILIYIVATNAGLIAVLAMAPKYFSHEGFRRTWKFLLIKFSPQTWWWGQVLIARGVIFNLILAVVETPIDQIWLCALVLVAYIFGLVYLMPWRHLSVNYLDIMCCLMFLLIVSMSASFAPQTGGDSEPTQVGLVIVAVFPAILILLVCALGLRWFLFQKEDVASKLKEAYEIRAVFRAFAGTGTAAAQAWAMRLNEMDWARLQAVRDLIATEMFQQQVPGQRRLLRAVDGKGGAGFKSYSGPQGLEAAGASATELSTAESTKVLKSVASAVSTLGQGRRKEISREAFLGAVAGVPGVGAGAAERLFAEVELNGDGVTTPQFVEAVAEAHAYIGTLATILPSNAVIV